MYRAADPVGETNIRPHSNSDKLTCCRLLIRREGVPHCQKFPLKNLQKGFVKTRIRSSTVIYSVNLNIYLYYCIVLFQTFRQKIVQCADTERRSISNRISSRILIYTVLHIATALVCESGDRIPRRHAGLSFHYILSLKGIVSRDYEVVLTIMFHS
jgi:hypothetical protein